MADKLKAILKIGFTPSKTSQLENDSGFVTKDDIEGIEVDLSDYITKEDVNNLLKGVAHLKGAETLEDKTLTNSTLKDGFDIVGNEENGERVSFSFIDGTLQIASNNGIDIAPEANFIITPTVENNDKISDLLPNNLISKKQAQQLTAGFITEEQVNQKLLNKADSETIDEVFEELSKIQNNKNVGGSSANNYGIQADYALHYGILDCPSGLIDFNVNNKEIEIQPQIVIQAAGADTRTTIASAIKYEVQETGNVVLFFTRTKSESGTIQTGFLEAGDVYYQEEEPTNGTTSYLAWWNPLVGKWKFKSDQTGNVWREAVATPIANIRAGTIGITSINYIGYRIIDDDVFVQQSEIESMQETIEILTNRLNALEGQS